MHSSEIRKQFFKFFQEKNHTLVPSAPVVPKDDPTLLFTNAGMNQFKDVFLDKGTRPYERAVDTQKCIRVSGKHNDLEEVGRDTYHHTFFEMLGNWSFGDYYKKEAISWAWELMTEVWKLPKNKLYATVYNTDDEAFNLWKEVTDIPHQHILKFGEKDNFWEMGDTGPCGPCSEIHIDLGDDIFERLGIDPVEGGVNSGSPRFIELWNLVFIQYFRDENGNLNDLSKKHIDTGMGFERVVAVLQNKVSNYDIDIFQDVISAIEEITGFQYGKSKENIQMAFRVIADHIRTLTFAITDGAIPSNEGRGYVLRRILRRAARYGKILNQNEPFMFNLVESVSQVMGQAFPEIIEKKDYVTKIVQIEEEQFNKTLDRGLDIFNSETDKLKESGSSKFPGETAFKLYDTFGFPMDLIRVLAEERGFVLDEEGFERFMEEQKKRARSAANFKQVSANELSWQVFSEDKPGPFTGYENTEWESNILRYAQLDDGNILVVLRETPFYAESGGQVADTGEIIGEKFSLRVLDVQKENDVFFHTCEFLQGDSLDNSQVKAVVDKKRRNKITYNHTATHLLHAALRSVLGDHVQQGGSLVGPDRFRFDFTHFQKLTAEEITKIEKNVNSEIRRNEEVITEIKSLDEAKSEGAMALFGEKYGDRVRTVTVPGFSKELCGGTHVHRTGNIGIFKIVLETSIAAGVRRIEAITADDVENEYYEKYQILKTIQNELNAAESEIINKVEQLLDERKSLQRENQELKKRDLQNLIVDLLKNSDEINTFKYVAHRFQNLDMDGLKELGDLLREKGKAGYIGLFSSVENDKITFCCAVCDDLIADYGLNAGKLVAEVAKVTGGGGGGRPHLATAGGRDIGKLDEAFDKMLQMLTTLEKK